MLNRQLALAEVPAVNELLSGMCSKCNRATYHPRVCQYRMQHHAIGYVRAPVRDVVNQLSLLINAFGRKKAYINQYLFTGHIWILAVI